MLIVYFRFQGINFIQSIKMKSSRSLNSVLVDCWQSNSIEKVFTVSFSSFIIDDYGWKRQFWSTHHLGEWHSYCTFQDMFSLIKHHPSPIPYSVKCAWFFKAFRMQKSTDMFTFRLYFVKNSYLVLFSCKWKLHSPTWVIYDFHLPKGLDTCIGKWASANFKPCQWCQRHISIIPH